MTQGKLVTFGMLAMLWSCQPSKTEQQGQAVDSRSADSSIYADGAHSSRNALDWSGEYRATVPCADCPGIATLVHLKEDETFLLEQSYLDKNVSTTDSGTFTWDSSGGIVTLPISGGALKFRVGEGRLIQLNMDGTAIDGAHKELYIYTKK